MIARALGRALGVEERMASPSFTIVAEYLVRSAPATRLVHVDLYRMQSDDEIELLGLEDLFTADTIAVVEWAERATWALPEAAIRITLSITGPSTRSVRIERPGN